MHDPDILLIEDNPQDIEMILDAFQEHDMIYTIQVLKDGAEALDYFCRLPGCLHEFPAQLPKVILLDLKLPRVNGLEVLKSLKSNEQTRTIPIVVFTSSDEHRDRCESYALGVNSYIVKPRESEKFSRTVADIGSYWVNVNRTIYNN